MQIKEIDIRHFGKLSNFRLTFSEGLNVLYGENEQGKSTILAFIKAMFYGFGNGSQDLLKNERKRYRPWSGEKMGGSVLFAYDGREYSLERSFGETKSGDKTKLINLSTGEAVSLQKGEEPGMRLFHMGLGAFENTAFIGQMGTVVDMSRDRKGDVMNQLTNLVSTGDAGVSYDLMKKRYKDAKEDLKKPRGGGKTDKLRREEAELVLKRAQAVEAQAERAELLAAMEADAARMEALQAEAKELFTDLSAQKALQKRQEIQNVLTAADKAEEAEAACAAAGEKLVFGGCTVTEETLAERRRDLSHIRDRETALQAAEEKAAAIRELKENAVTERERICGEADAACREAEVWLESKRELFEKAEKYQANTAEELQRQRSVFEQSLILEEEVRQKLEGAKEDRSAAELALRLLQEGGRETQAREPGKLWFLLAGLFLLAAVGLGVFVHPACFALAVVSLLCLALQKRGRQEPETAEDAENPLEEALSRADSTQAYCDKLAEDLAGARKRAEDAKAEIAYLEQEKEAAQTMYQEALSQKAAAEEKAAAAKATAETAAGALQKAKGDLAESEARDAAVLSGLRSRVEEAKAELLETMAPMGDFSTEADVLNWIQAMESLLAAAQEAAARADRAQDQLTQLAAGRSMTELKEKLIALEESVPPETVLLPEDAYLAMNRRYHETQEALQALAVAAEGQKKELQHKFLHTPDFYETEKRLREIAETVREQEHYYRVLETAESLLDEAFEEMQMSFGPEVNQRTVGILKQLTGARYEDAIVSKELQVMVREKTDRSLRQWEYLSGGTADQVYFALRCAVSCMIAPEGETLPLLLDDVFVQYDDERMQLAMDFLQKVGAGGNQVLLFTCHSRILEAANQEEIRKLA